MTIQWFPGHMNAARRKAAETMAKIDVVIEVVDARLPAASSNPMIEELRKARQRPCLKVLNKSDLADPEATQAWLDHFNSQPGMKAVANCCKKPNEVARIPRLCQQLAPHRNDGTKPLRMLIMGIPNVGKSTLMNALGKRKVAKVGDEPAVTKQQQRLDLSPTMSLTDTPGLLWPKIEYDLDGFMLAASHAVGVNAVSEEDVAYQLGDLLLAAYPERLKERYKLTSTDIDGVELVQTVGRKRGCVGKGGVLDIEKAALVLLGEYRSGALGLVSLETPASRARMIAEADEARRLAEAQKQVEGGDA